MKLHALEVEDFRGIHRAMVTFGPGLTVLHGPNELGKSTLVEAIHAALFVQSGSVAGNDHVQWGTKRPARVTLTFEHQERLWKVTKHFGSKPYAKLETSESIETPRFHEVLTGKGVEGRIRELLAWGIASPGGKGAAPKPESFLLTALVGRQGEVQKVFEASLDADKDDAGRSLVNQALGALDKDPLVGLLLEKLAARVEPFFTDQGKLKTAADSPLVKLQNHLRAQQALLDTLRSDAAKGQTIQAEVVRLQDEHERLVVALADATRLAADAAAQHARVQERAALQRTVDDLRERLAAAAALRSQMAEFEAQLVACDARLDALRTGERSAAERHEQTRLHVQAAAEDVARAREAVKQSGAREIVTAEKHRAELELQRTAIQMRLADVQTADDAVSARERVEREWTQAMARRDACEEQVALRTREVEYATLRETLAQLAARQREIDEAADALAAAGRVAQVARDQLQRAAERVRLAEAARDRSAAGGSSDALRSASAEREALEAATAQIAIDRVRAEVAACEHFESQARDARAAATRAREHASEIDTACARRVLPTPEQVASWRALQAEIAADDTSPAPASSSSVGAAVLAGVAALVVGTAAAYTGFGLPLPASLAAGLVLGAMAVLAVWALQRGRPAAASSAFEQRVRRRDRWAQEVQPSLRAAGLAGIADYESALASREQQKADAQRRRDEADAHDRDASAYERQAAPLQSYRVELERLERARPAVDVAAVAAAVTSCGGDVQWLQRQMAVVQQRIDEERARIRATADQMVAQADGERAAAQADYDTAAKQVTAAETALAFRRQQVDGSDVARLETRLRELDIEIPVSLTPADGQRALDDAKAAHVEAATQTAGLQRARDEAVVRAARLEESLGDTREAARVRAEQEMAAIDAELNGEVPAAGAGPDATALDEATQTHAALEAQLTAHLLAQQAAAAAVAACEAERADMNTALASVRGQWSGFDVPALEAQLAQAMGNPVFEVVSGEPPLDPAAASAQVATLQKTLELCSNDLSHAKGQLHLTSGHVGSERLSQQEEAVALAEAEVRECERTERGALRLLREIERVENERATHLGRVLAGPVSQAFRALTGARYGQISLAPDLKTEHIEAGGEGRPIERLSLGAREQLATLLRLAIAGYLRTALVLDDQLVHSDSGRLAWFNQKLRESVSEHGHQVIVFTCRPGDYLRDDGDEGITAIDLTTLVSY